MSWTILIYALIVGLGPTLWNFLFATKISDRIRHIKDYVDTIGSEDMEKKKVSEMIRGFLAILYPHHTPIQE